MNCCLGNGRGPPFSLRPDRDHRATRSSRGPHRTVTDGFTGRSLERPFAAATFPALLRVCGLGLPEVPAAAGTHPASPAGDGGVSVEAPTPEGASRRGCAGRYPAAWGARAWTTSDATIFAPAITLEFDGLAGGRPAALAAPAALGNPNSSG